MRVVVVTESFFGCTAALGDAVAAAISAPPTGVSPWMVRQVEVHPVATAPIDLRDADLVVVGAATHVGGLSSATSRCLHAQFWGDPEHPARAHRPHGRPGRRRTMRRWLSLVRLRRGGAVAVFDTRSRSRAPGTAGAAIARRLRRRGTVLVLPPEAFFVDAVPGPLAGGEVARAARWASSVVSAARSGR